MPPKRKRLPTPKAAANAEPKRPKRVEHSGSLSESERQSIVADLVPAVTKSVVETLMAMQVLPLPSTSQHQPTTSNRPTPPVPSSQNHIIEENPVEASVSGGCQLPLQIHVDQKIKSKIWSNEFVDFSVLLKPKDSNSTNDSLRMVESTNGVLLLKKVSKKVYKM